LLMLRFDKLGQFEEIIKQHTRFKKLKIDSENISSKKDYAELYSEFKKKLKIPRALLETLFLIDESPMNYFYSRSEVESIKQKWYDGSSDAEFPVPKISTNFDWKQYAIKHNKDKLILANHEYYFRKHFIVQQL
jgi:hypothetical protein